MDAKEIPKMIDESYILENSGHIYKDVISNTERLLIEKVLKRTGGNQIWAARILGLNRNTLRTKIRKLNISMESFKG